MHSVDLMEAPRRVAEAVRLVVWDLDGTFWNGTLTEGGHTYSEANHSIVVELARRGIVSSICSKNDFQTVKEILTEKGIWDYFVFPSIDWTPKGPRLKKMINDVQLRPETILLLDDNPLNLREAAYFMPGIQTADDGFIPSLLQSPLLKGKEDGELSRLRQYKLLETRKADEAVADDNIDFLKSCDIRVSIDRDVEPQIDRAIELINRTNQLNFTKKRLPENPKKARAKLGRLLGKMSIQSGLVRVTDRYGDYGFCGFYLSRTFRGRTRLLHYCFSCRILNMGVETWLYRRMGRPAIDVEGEVLTDLSSEATIDWVREADSPQTGRASAGLALPHVLIRGACAVSPLTHYFQAEAQTVIGEFNVMRDGVHSIRIDHTLMLRYAIEGISPQLLSIFRRLGFEDQDLVSAFTDLSRLPAVRVLSSWVDLQSIVYRHKITGLLVPYKAKLGGLDPIEGPGVNDPAFAKLPQRVQDALVYLRDNFESVGQLPIEEAAHDIQVISDAVRGDSLMFFLSIPEETSGKKKIGGAELNRLVTQAAKVNPRIVPISILDLAGAQDSTSIGHFHSRVYYKLFCEIRARCERQFFPERVQ